MRYKIHRLTDRQLSCSNFGDTETSFFKRYFHTIFLCYWFMNVALIYHLLTINVVTHYSKSKLLRIFVIVYAAEHFSIKNYKNNSIQKEICLILLLDATCIIQCASFKILSFCRIRNTFLYLLFCHT